MKSVLGGMRSRRRKNASFGLSQGRTCRPAPRLNPHDPLGRTRAGTTRSPRGGRCRPALCDHRHLGDRRDISTLLPIAERGAFLGIDNIGYHDYQKEERRAQNVIDLIEAGFRSQVLLSMDIATLNDLKSYGGKGFDYLLLEFIPLLRRLGATDEDVQALLIENPQRALAFSELQRPLQPV